MDNRMVGILFLTIFVVFPSHGGENNSKQQRLSLEGKMKNMEELLEVRIEAVKALAVLRDDRSIDTLIRCALFFGSEEHGRFREEIFLALGEFTPELVLPHLLYHLPHFTPRLNEYEKNAIENSLERLNNQTRKIEKNEPDNLKRFYRVRLELEDILQDSGESPDVRIKAVNLLGELGNDESVVILEKCARLFGSQKKHGRLREEIIIALSKFSPEITTPFLINCCLDISSSRLSENEQNAVVNSLKRLTNQNFGLDQNAWKKWLLNERVGSAGAYLLSDGEGSPEAVEIVNGSAPTKRTQTEPAIP